MTNFEELLNIKLNEDKYVLARIVIDYMKRSHQPVPEWAIRVDAEGRRKEAAGAPPPVARPLPAAESVVVDRGAGVRKTRKRRG